MRILATAITAATICFSACARAAACDGFTDVDSANTTYCSAVTYLKDKGITLGCTGTTYCPNDYVTRLQMALFLQRAGKGGPHNTLGDYTTSISGGDYNAVSGQYETVAGGYGHTSSGFAATISGGSGNATAADYATASGGTLNTASGLYAVVAGGHSNTASAQGAVIAGGKSNVASSLHATIGGGFLNVVDVENSTIGGGVNNHATGGGAGTIGGGTQNYVAGAVSVVGGGYSNMSNDDYSTVGGGASNTAAANSATVGGGANNQASAAYATVGGGAGNRASGAGSTVAGGEDNVAGGSYSVALGNRAKAMADGSFVFGDSTAIDIGTSTANQFLVGASGGIRMLSNKDGLTGCSIVAGGGSWACTSSREVKRDFSPIDTQDVLARALALPVMRWRYMHESPDIRHMGTFSQDFRAAFGLGSDDKSITLIDAEGVALAAIQGLNAKLEASNAKLDNETRAKDLRIDDLEKRLAKIESALPR